MKTLAIIGEVLFWALIFTLLGIAAYALFFM